MKHHDLMEGLLGRPIFDSPRGPVSDPAWSVRNNLKVLLNARQNTVSHLPDYGLPDVSQIYKDFPDSIASLRQAILDTIREFEPRLTDVEVRLENREDLELMKRIIRNPGQNVEDGFADNIFRPSYLVTAKLTSDFTDTSIEFRTNIHSDGNIEIV